MCVDVHIWLLDAPEAEAESPSMSAGNWIQILCTSSKYS